MAGRRPRDLGQSLYDAPRGHARRFPPTRPAPRDHARCAFDLGRGCLAPTPTLPRAGEEMVREARGALVRHCGLADLGLLKGRHHLRGKPLELLETYLFWHADGQAHRHPVEAGVAPFEALQMLEDLLRRTAQKTA